MLEAHKCADSLHLAWEDPSTDRIHDYRFSTAEFNEKVWAFVRNDIRPPLKEAFFIHKLPDRVFDDVLLECMEVAVASELIVAESDIFLGFHPFDSVRFKKAWAVLNELSPSEFHAVNSIWLVQDLVSRFNSQLEDAPRPVSPTVSVVVCHCRENLEWLVKDVKNIPHNSSLHVYEKCGMNSTEFLTNGFRGGSKDFESIFVYDQRDGPVRGDECTAYLDYIVSNYETLSDFTVFLQGDPDRHMFLSYLSTALAGIVSGRYSVPFLHLNFHRHYQTTTPCMRDVEKLILSNVPEDAVLPLIGTYCCAQFIVSRDRIVANSRNFYANALSLVNGSVADVCSPVPPRRSSHCYVLEYLWHVVFGEDRFLPFKPDDLRLPTVLRMKYGNENAKVRWDDVELQKHTKRLINRTVDF